MAVVCYRCAMLQKASLVLLGIVATGLAPMSATAAEQAGPPISAAPPSPAPVPPYAPPGRAPAVGASRTPPRSAASDEASYERCMKLATSDPGAARDMA